MAQDLPSIESLYDFIYVDTKRLTSYLAQLDPHGALTGIKTTATKNTNDAYGVNLAVPFVKSNKTASETDISGVERQFDPLWTIPLTVLNRLDELSFIRRSMVSARIGELFLAKGYLQILDIRMLKDLWEHVIPHAAEQINEAAGMTRQVRRNANRRGAKQGSQEAYAKKLAEGLKKLPHALQMHLLTSEFMLWATLNPDHMLVMPDDFLLKHGSAVPGEWYILGVIDSFGTISSATTWAQFDIGPIAKGMTLAADSMREQFGRPDNSVAITPLIVFRSIGIPSDEAPVEQPDTPAV